MFRSVLGHMLPEAMVCYLENYEPERFAEIFLGEFDTPEAIWSREMRSVNLKSSLACRINCHAFSSCIMLHYTIIRS